MTDSSSRIGATWSGNAYGGDGGNYDNGTNYAVGVGGGLAGTNAANGSGGNGGKGACVQGGTGHNDGAVGYGKGGAIGQASYPTNYYTAGNQYGRNAGASLFIVADKWDSPSIAVLSTGGAPGFTMGSKPNPGPGGCGYGGGGGSGADHFSETSPQYYYAPGGGGGFGGGGGGGGGYYVRNGGGGGGAGTCFIYCNTSALQDMTGVVI